MEALTAHVGTLSLDPTSTSAGQTQGQTPLQDRDEIEEQFHVIPTGAYMTISPSPSGFTANNSIVGFCVGKRELPIQIPIHKPKKPMLNGIIHESAYGVLYRGPELPVVVTASGFSTPEHIPLPAQSIPVARPAMQQGLPHQLNKVLWARAAVAMCAILDVPMPRTEGYRKDYERFEHQYWTCHVEAQLLAYVFTKHTALAFTPELRLIAADLGLFKQLPEENGGVVIHVDRSVCRNCRKVIVKFMERTEIEVSVFVDGTEEEFERPERKPPRPRSRWVPRKAVIDVIAGGEGEVE